MRRGAASDRFAKHVGGRLCDRRPAEGGADARSLASCGGERLGLVDETADSCAQRVGVAEAEQLAGAGREHVARIPVRRRHGRTACAEREGERARNALLAARIRGDEDVGGGEQVGQLADVEEAVVELDVLGEIEVADATLEHQAVLLTFPTRDLRVRAAGDQIQHLGMTLDDRRHRVEHHLDALPRREQAERAEEEARVHSGIAAGGHVPRAPTRIQLCACARELDRRSVRDDVDPSLPRRRRPVRAAAWRSPSSRSRARPRRRAPSRRGVGAPSVPRARYAVSRRAAGRARGRTRERTRRPCRRRCRTRVEEARCRRRSGPTHERRERSRRGRPGRRCAECRAAAGWTARRSRRADSTSSTSWTSSSAFRMSKEKVPIPQARGGNVEKIAVRTFGAPLSPDVRGLRKRRRLDRLVASVAASALSASGWARRARNAAGSRYSGSPEFVATELRESQAIGSTSLATVDLETTDGCIRPDGRTRD